MKKLGQLTLALFLFLSVKTNAQFCDFTAPSLPATGCSTNFLEYIDNTQIDGLTIMISSYSLKTTPSIIQLKPFEFESIKTKKPFVMRQMAFLKIIIINISQPLL